jgi:hypothetical protein
MLGQENENEESTDVAGQRSFAVADADVGTALTEGMAGETKTGGPKKSLWYRLKVIVLFLFALTLLLAAAAAYIYQSAQEEPEFYASALVEPEEALAEQGGKFETKILNLRNAAMTPGDWEAEFTDAQINGWLASELKKKFPEILSDSIKDPRVVINAGKATIACRAKFDRLDGIVVVEADLFLTDVINQIGVQFKKARCGVLPIPISTFSDEISESLAKQNIQIQWKTEAGDPVALLDLPDKLTVRADGNWYEIMDVELKENCLRLVGRTNEQDF